MVFNPVYLKNLRLITDKLQRETQEKWLVKELETAEEDIGKGRFYTMEEVQEQLDKMLRE